MPSRRALMTGMAATAVLAPVGAFAVPLEPDPIYSAIEQVRLAEIAMAAVEAEADGDISDSMIGPAIDQLDTARSGLARTVATTPAGLAALTAFLREAQGKLQDDASYFEEAEDADAFAVSLDTAVRGMAGLKPWEGLQLSPSAALAIAAAKPDRKAMKAYASWLFMERRILCMELYPNLGAEAERFDLADNAGYGWHFRGGVSWKERPQPSSRAAGVLQLVGVDWASYRREPAWSITDTGARPALPPSWPAVDAELIDAVAAMKAADVEIDRLYRLHGDTADERDDYQKQNDVRDDALETLAETPARSRAGIEAKAEALRESRLIESFEEALEVAQSLADDIAADAGRPDQVPA